MNRNEKINIRINDVIRFWFRKYQHYIKGTLFLSVFVIQHKQGC